jgi:hypothetical protein
MAGLKSGSPDNPGSRVSKFATQICNLATVVSTRQVFPCNPIAAAVTLLKGPLLIAGNIGMPKGIVPIEVGTETVIEVVAGGLNAMPEPVAANVIIAVRECIPASPSPDHGRWTVSRRRRSKVRHGYVVAAKKAVTIRLAHRSGHARMAIFKSIVGVWSAAVCKVVARRFNSLVKPTALNVVPRVIGPIPIASILSKSRGDGRGRRCVNARSREQYKCCTSTETCDAKPIEIH